MTEKKTAKSGASASRRPRTKKARVEEVWQGPSSEIGAAVERYSAETLAAYREAPRFVEEHANLERAAVEGGYGRRQLFELVQNGADELVESAGPRTGRTDGKRAVLRKRRSAAVRRRCRCTPVVAPEQQARRGDRPLRPRVQVRPRCHDAPGGLQPIGFAPVRPRRGGASYPRSRSGGAQDARPANRVRGGCRRGGDRRSVPRRTHDVGDDGRAAAARHRRQLLAQRRPRWVPESIPALLASRRAARARQSGEAEAPHDRRDARGRRGRPRRRRRVTVARIRPGAQPQRSREARRGGDGRSRSDPPRVGGSDSQHRATRRVLGVFPDARPDHVERGRQRTVEAERRPNAGSSRARSTPS